MNFKELKNKFKDMLIIDAQSINLLDNPAYFRRQLSDWKKKKWLIELRKGMYVINDLYFKEKLSLLYLANQIYQPSYISLEYALSEYELIPEKVNVITSISTRKTSYFENDFGMFKYTKIKNNCFFGYRMIVIDVQKVLYATKEKALLDYLYINSHIDNNDAFDESRIQNLESLNWKKLYEYGSKFKNAKLMRTVKLLMKYFKEEGYKSL